MAGDDDLRALASVQHALVAWEQARRIGFSREALRHRLARGDWRLETPRVLGLAGVPGSEHRHLMAAALDAGTGAYVDLRSAAWLWEVPGFPPARTVDLARRRGSSGRRPTDGHVRTLRYLPDHLTTTVRGIPVLTLPFLLFRLAGTEREARVERALNTICTRSPAVLLRLHELLPELAEHGRNGSVFMRDWLDRNPPGSRPVASGLEGRFQRILLEAGHRPLARQVDVGGHDWIGRVDFADLEVGALFEVDSLVHHTSELDVALDAERDRQLYAAGWRAVERIPEEWIWHERDRAVAVVRDVRRRLRRQLRPSGS
jgi:very-short-patch-repair endonuclease